MPGNIDHAEAVNRGRCISGRPVDQIEVAETQIDREPPLPLFRQAVRVHSGQSFHQGTFAMVHMPGRGQDKRLYRSCRFHSINNQEVAEPGPAISNAR
jgi:hypothetical protein